MIVADIDGYDSWRLSAWRLLRASAHPRTVAWREGADPLAFGSDDASPDPRWRPPPIPPRFGALARLVSMHRDPKRWMLLYDVLWRLTHGEPRLLDVEVDHEVRRLNLLEKAVSRDVYRMHALVRFRPSRDEDGERWIAFHRPDHRVLRAAVPFFVRRHGERRWAILTPDEGAWWDGEELSFGPGAAGSPVAADEVEELWKTYYASVFNPARLKVREMVAQLPRRHWSTLPEASLIPDLVAGAAERTAAMAVEEPISAEAFLPAEDASWHELRSAAMGCRGCPLHEHATQTVFGEGPLDAALMLIGEAPGDEEDRAGRCFVGPAGRLLDRALAEAGIERSRCYVTNAVKHFKYLAVDGRREHKTPISEVPACRAWILREIRRVRPRVIACLGATAARSILGRAVAVARERGELIAHHLAPRVLVTAHPASVLRQPDPRASEAAYARLVADLRLARVETPDARAPGSA